MTSSEKRAAFRARKKAAGEVRMVTWVPADRVMAVKAAIAKELSDTAEWLTIDIGPLHFPCAKASLTLTRAEL
jgi:hypothetical protein